MCLLCIHWTASQFTIWSLPTYTRSVSQIYTSGASQPIHRGAPAQPYTRVHLPTYTGVTSQLITVVYFLTYTGVPSQLILQYLPTYTGVHPTLHKGAFQPTLVCLSTYTGVPSQPKQWCFPSPLTQPPPAPHTPPAAFQVWQSL